MSDQVDDLTTPTLPPEPLALDSIELSGATRFGKPVARVVIYLSDGKKRALDLPEPGEEDSRYSNLSPTQRRILNLLAASPIPMSRKVIASKVNKGNTTGRFGSDVRVLLSEGHVFEHANEITDDLNKFAPRG